jgi:antitoxin VapB
MAFHVRDPETDRIVRALAARTGKSLTETIRAACEAKLEEVPAPEAKPPLAERIRHIAERLGTERTGLVADKAFYDSLSGEED